MHRRAILTAIFLLAAHGVALASPQSKPEKAKEAQQASHSAANASAAQDSEPPYVIGASDVLDVNVWKEPDVTRSVPVRPDGKISLPLINDVQAAGLTPQQLAASITEKLRKFLTDPQVTVIVSQINSQKIYITGEVARAGAFQLTPGMTVLQAITSAGGFTAYANTKGIYVLRVRDGKQFQLPFNYRDVIKGKNTAQNVTLEPGDTVVVP